MIVAALPASQPRFPLASTAPEQEAEAERHALLAAPEPAAPAPAGRMLLEFKGIGPELAAVLLLEALFRHFDNRRQLAS
jgi:transposase